MAEKIKYTRKDLKSPDEFISTVGRATAWMKANRSRVIAASVLVAIAAAGVAGTYVYIQRKEAAASRELWPILDRTAVYLRDPAANAEEGARLEQTLTGFVARHPGTKSSVFAQYYLGSLAYRRGDFDAGADRFRSALAGKGEKGTVMEYLLRLGLAQALEAGGKLEESRKTYGEAADIATGELRTQALMAQARTLTALGRKQEAASVFRRILEENPDTPLKDLIQVKLAHLE